MRKLFSVSVFLGLLFLLYPQTPAEVPRMINYQGKLTTAQGGCLNDTVQMTFSIYPDTNIGTPADWTEDQDTVIVKEGIFNVLLGSVNPIPDMVFDGNTKYLGVQVESDPEMRPLKPMVSVAYAFKSLAADTADYARVAVSDGDWTQDGDNIYRLQGNVGIGTTSPEAKLEVGDATDIGGGTLVSARLGGAYDHWTYFGDGNCGRIRGSADGYLYLSSNPDGIGDKNVYLDASGANIILSDGNVGIGSQNPDHKLTVDGGLSVQGNEALTQMPDILQLGGRYGSPVAGRICFGDGSGWKLHISKAMPLTDLVTFDDNGNVGIGTTNPGASLDVQRKRGTGICSKVTYADEEHNCGVFGQAEGASQSNIGVYGFAAAGEGFNVGVAGYGVWIGSQYGVYGMILDPGPDDYAGYFEGNVRVTGTLSKGGGGFLIDHPIDSENKYLSHSFVESPDMMNVYNGNVILDANGEATVELPKYFGAVNKDFRYQLTCVGGFAPVYIAAEISANSFKIAGGQPSMKVSWQVTGIRKDRFAEANRIQVVVDKLPKEKGKYLHPEAFGLGPERGINYELNKHSLEMAQKKEKPEQKR